MPTVRFSREPLTDALWNEALPLLVDHWAECGNDTPFRPSLTSYGQLEANGVLRVFTARQSIDNAEWGEPIHGIRPRDPLVGYAMFTVLPSLNTGALEAQQDVHRRLQGEALFGAEMGDPLVHPGPAQTAYAPKHLAALGGEPGRIRNDTA